MKHVLATLALLIGATTAHAQILPTLQGDVTTPGGGSHVTMIAPGAVTTSKIANGAVTAAQLGAGAAAANLSSIMSGDCGITSSGIVTCLKTGGVAFGALATQSSVTASQLPTPTGSSLGGVEAAAATAHNWVASIDLSGVPHLSQPGFADISGVLAAGQLATGAAAANLSASMSGDCGITSSGVVTCTKTNGVALGSAATQAASAFDASGAAAAVQAASVQKANNLSDVNAVLARGNLGLSYGRSVGNAGAGAIEALTPIQTVSGASYAFTCATDAFQKTRRLNSGAAMSDTLPAAGSACLINGAQIQISNVDAAANDTVAAGAGTTISGGASFVIAPLRDLWLAYDATTATWRPQANSASALLSNSNLGASVLTPAGVSAGYTQTLAQLAQQSGVLLETFDTSGGTDFTAAILSEAAAGVPILLGPRSYNACGNINITSSVTFVGTAGVSKITCASPIPVGVNDAWLEFSGSNVLAIGVTFDENGKGATNNVWCAKTLSGVKNLRMINSSIVNCAGTLGYGMWVASDMTAADDPYFLFQNVEAANNAQDGLRIDQALNVHIVDPRAHGNGRHGVEINYALGTDTSPIQRVRISGGEAYSNTLSGVYVGNFQLSLGSPPVYGNGSPSVDYVTIEGMTNYNNGAYGLQLANNYVKSVGNTLTANAYGQSVGSTTGGGGILLSCQYCMSVGDTVDSNGYYGIDAGGCLECQIVGDTITGGSLSVNLGATIGAVVRDSKLYGFAYAAINVPVVDGSGAGVAFPQVTRDVYIQNNDIEMSSMGPTAYAILATDGVQNVNVFDNRFRFSQAAYNAGMRPTQALQAITDNINVGGNSITMPIRAGATTQLTTGKIYDLNPTGSSNWEAVPDVLTDVRISSTSWTLGNLTQYTSYNHATGEISWVNVTAGGSGYVAATTTVSFSCSGATGIVAVYNGAVIGVQMTARGSSCGTSPTATISDTSGGTGATLTVQENVPVSRNRRIRVYAKTAGTISSAGTYSTQNLPGSVSSISVAAGQSFEAVESGAFVNVGGGGAWNIDMY